jgi:hypothetical protein
VKLIELAYMCRSMVRVRVKLVGLAYSCVLAKDVAVDGCGVRLGQCEEQTALSTIYWGYTQYTHGSKSLDSSTVSILLNVLLVGASDHNCGYHVHA